METRNTQDLLPIAKDTMVLIAMHLFQAGIRNKSYEMGASPCLVLLLTCYGI